MSQKYKLTSEIKQIKNMFTREITTLYRIKALKDFSDVKEGDLGGFIEKESNLSHDGNCWVYNEACVYNNAHVSDNATVCDYASVFDNAKIESNSKVFDCARIYDNAKITGYTYICDKVSVFGNSYIDTKKLNGHINICDQTIKDSA
ncbi:hypothetical protein [Bartonella pachyuromydis]|uniref:Phage related protein n=1 Tax=Bartonella pachyuromydis TaxID=931097 RepID=A0ABP8VMI9_9HYPH